MILPIHKIKQWHQFIKAPNNKMKLFNFCGMSGRRSTLDQNRRELKCIFLMMKNVSELQMKTLKKCHI